MVKIRDPLHRTVQLTDLEEELLDCRSMQRLRGIRQLAMAYLVYPGANHTRFEHSIGTLFLADRICHEMGLAREKAEKVRLSALLHDVGHVAFSHEAEEILKKKLGTHEEIGKKLVMDGEIADILKAGGQSPKEIASLYESPLGQIITSDLGADRMDYLLRDSLYTGVAYGVIDADRICSCLSLSKQGLVLQGRGLEAAENLLVARFTMFSTVYLHKTVRIASRMLQEAIALALDDGTFLAEEAKQMSDSQMLGALCRSKREGEYALRLMERRLYKKAHSVRANEMKMGAREAEGELSEKCGCDVLIDVPKLSSEAHIMLEEKEGQIPLSEASELVSSLQKMQRRRLEALIICEEKNVKKVGEAARKLLGYQSIL